MFEGRNAKWIYAAIAILWVAIVVRLAVNVKGPEDFVVTVPQADVQAFARTQLDEMQARSIAENVELCAILFEDSSGDLGRGTIHEGDEGTCDLRYFDEPGMAPVASIHTHAGYDADYDSEVPSMLDLESDIESRMDGYVATPGGRLWRIDWQAPRAVQVCGEGCLRQDSAYRACPDDPIATSYSAAQLAARSRRSIVKC